MRVGSGDVRLLQIYNQYRSLFGGEGTVVNRISDLVERHSGESMLLMKTSIRRQKSIRNSCPAAT